jgi:hypothetical protein
MVNIQKFLLALLAIGDCPTPIFLLPVFAATVTGGQHFQGLCARISKQMAVFIFLGISIYLTDFSV